MQASAGPAEDGQTILVVEDFGALRALVARILESGGFTVLAAADGVEALALAEQYDGTIDLLFTDIVMPRMGGRELSERLLAGDPRLRVVFTSGYAADDTLRSEIAAGQASFIEKPYANSDLLALIHATLAC